MLKPLLIRQSPLTGRWYAFRSYRAKNDGIEVTGTKEDVTEQIDAILKQREAAIEHEHGDK